MKKIAIFIFKCIAVCFGALLLLFALNFRYEQVMERPYRDADKFHYINSDYNNIQICNIGSSHGEYAFSYDDLASRRGYECFNFAMSSQTYDFDYAILSMYQKHFSDPCLMFIPVSYFSFNNEVTSEKEAQFLNAKYYTFLSPRYIPSYDPYTDLVTHRLPLLSAGEDIVKILPSLSLKAHSKETQEEKIPASQSPAAGNGKTELEEAELQEAEFRKKAQNRYHRHMDNKEDYFLPERIGNLYDILTFCKDNNITPVLITTPYTGFYSGLFPKEFKEEFRQTINAVSKESGVPYYDYSEDKRFSDVLNYFSDADHLNAEGSAYFMEIIEKEIPEFREFLRDL